LGSTDSSCPGHLTPPMSLPRSVCAASSSADGPHKPLPAVLVPSWAARKRSTYFTLGGKLAKACHKELAELYEERLREKGLTVSTEPTANPERPTKSERQREGPEPGEGPHAWRAAFVGY